MSAFTPVITEGILPTSPVFVQEFIAQSTIPALRAIYIDNNIPKLYDSANQALCGLFFGISLNSAAPGDILKVQTSGRLQDVAWAWANSPIFVSAGGVLTQTPPTTGFLQQIAVPIAPDALIIQPKIGVLLNG